MAHSLFCQQKTADILMNISGLKFNDVTPSGF